MHTTTDYGIHIADDADVYVRATASPETEDCHAHARLSLRIDGHPLVFYASGMGQLRRLVDAAVDALDKADQATVIGMDGEP